MAAAARSSSIRTKPTAAQPIGRSTHAKTTGLSTAGRCPTRRSRCTSARFCSSAASLFYFAAHRWYDAVAGVVAALLVLGLPFAGPTPPRITLYRRITKPSPSHSC